MLEDVRRMLEECLKNVRREGIGDGWRKGSVNFLICLEVGRSRKKAERG